MPGLGTAAAADRRGAKEGWLDWAGTLARLGLAVVWIWAGLAKVTPTLRCCRFAPTGCSQRS